jgi:hypothetical protein
MFPVDRPASEIGSLAFTEEEQYSVMLPALGSANDPFALAYPLSPGKRKWTVASGNWRGVRSGP